MQLLSKVKSKHIFWASVGIFILATLSLNTELMLSSMALWYIHSQYNLDDLPDAYLNWDMFEKLL